jgi:hypothetical protein
MSIPIEAYTAEGVVTGLCDASGRLRDLLETLDSVRLAPIRVIPLHGPVRDRPEELVPTDELLFVVPDAPDTLVHAVWHDIRVLAGPWRVDAVLATQPGFDPGRALARPGGTFVALHDASVYRRADPARPLSTHLDLLANRYAVEDVECLLTLPFHFPGATLRHVQPVPAVGAAAD